MVGLSSCDPTSHSTDDRLERISASVYMLRDSCNAFAIVDADRALVIDPGSGRIAEELRGVGVEQVEWVLHTHHHRDQCWGDYRLLRAGAKIAVPEYERHLFDQTESFWQSKRVFGSYSDRSTAFSLGRSLSVAATLDDYETFNWRGYEFFVLPAKGHTYGSSALIVRVDGTSLAFTGDLIAHGGTLHQVHSLDYFHGYRAGVTFTLQSLRALRKHRPDLILPSHGPLVRDPSGDIDRLEERLLRLVDLGLVRFEFVATSREDLSHMSMSHLSPHLLWGGPHTCSNFYVIKSESGKALFIDYGHSLHAYLHLEDAEPLDRLRFIEHHLDELREVHGITSFDVVIPTHTHDDHVCGIPFLQRHHGTECWALEAVGQVLADPAAWASSAGAMDKPIQIDRWLKDREHFSWEEYEFTIYHAPGHSEFHALISVEIDGRRVAFTGDNYGRGRQGVADPVVRMTAARDSFQFVMRHRCREAMREARPDLICPGHFQPYETAGLKIDGDDFDQIEEAFRALAASPADQSVDVFWARLLPYYKRVAPGEPVRYRLLVRNNFGRDVTVLARLNASRGSRDAADAPDASPTAESVTLALNARTEIDLIWRAPDDLEAGRHVVTAEVDIDGRSFGPVVEAIVDLVDDRR